MCPVRFCGWLNWTRVTRPPRCFLSFSAAPLCAFPSLCRATHQETTVKLCWFSAEGKINFVTSLQPLLQTSVWKTTRQPLRHWNCDTLRQYLLSLLSVPNQSKPSQVTPTPRPFKTLFVRSHLCFLSFDFLFLFFYDQVCYFKMFRLMWPCMSPLTSD